MSTVPGHWQFEDVFDALELGCGQLLLELHRFVAPFRPGARIMLATRDAASRIDVPAWCRMTGHRLIEHSHPFYLIERKNNHRP